MANNFFISAIANLEEEDEDQSLKLALGQPWVWSVNDFIFLATAYEGGWPVLSLTISSSHWQSAVSVLIIIIIIIIIVIIITSSFIWTEWHNKSHYQTTK